MHSHPDRQKLDTFRSAADPGYKAWIQAAFEPLDDAASVPGKSHYLAVTRTLRDEVLSDQGLAMLRDCYSGDSSLGDWLDLVVRKRASSSGDLPDPGYVDRLLAGDPSTLEDFVPRARGWLEARLFSTVHGGREREEARRVIDDVISDLYGKDLLKKFSGSGSFPAWLCRVAKNRLMDALEKASFRHETEFPRDESGEPAEGRLMAAPEPTEIDATVLATLREGLACAFSRLPPRQLFLVRLVFLHGVQRQTLAGLLRKHPSGIGIEIKNALETVTSTLGEFMRAVDPDGTLDLSDYVFLSEQFQAALHGDA